MGLCNSGTPFWPVHRYVHSLRFDMFGCCSHFMQEQGSRKDRSVLFRGVTALSVTTVNKNTQFSEVQMTMRRTEDLHTIFLHRVINKSLRDFRTRLRNNQDRHSKKEHINK
jgi:hypothetical protein